MRLTRQAAYLMAAAWLAVSAWSSLARRAAAEPELKLDALSRAVQDVQQAANAEQATAAYNRGCAVNRQSKELQEGYLRQMLLFGRPLDAYQAALDLAALDTANGLAWGTLAYVQLQKNLLAKALPLALRAAVLAPDNPSICQNAAQLVAWYNELAEAERPTLSPQCQQDLAELTAAKSSSKTFSAAYQTAKAAFDKLKDDRKGAAARADDAEKEAKDLEKKLAKVNQDLNKLGNDYKQARSRVLAHQRDLANLNRSRGSYDARQYRDTQNRRRKLIDDIRKENDNADKAYDAGKKLLKEREDLEDKIRGKRDQAARIKRDAAKSGPPLPGSFRWLPPAVDGKVTPDASVEPKKVAAARPAASQPTPATQATAKAPLGARLADIEAADKLNLARMCLRSNLKDGAQRLLNEIITSYPDTPSAQEARTLLASLQTPTTAPAQ